MEAPMKKKRILIADDEPVMQDLMASALEIFGYKIDVVKNGLEAMDRIKRVSYDLLITDYVMPKMNGLELSRWVKSNHPTVPIIMVTGTTPAQENLKSEATALISKPFKVSKFQRVVKQTINRGSEIEGIK